MEWNTLPPILIAGGHIPNAIHPNILVSLMTFPQSPRFVYKFSFICGYHLLSHDD